MYNNVIARSRTQNLAAVFGWMFIGLLISGFVAYTVGTNPALINPILSSKWLVWGLFAIELILVFAITSFAERASATLAGGLFLIFATINGLTLSVIFLAYNINTIYLAFIVTAGVFGATCIYGLITKDDLSKLSGILFMGLSGLIIATIANWFLASQTLDWIISYAGVAIFVGYTAYDIQQAKFLQLSPINSALSLYLDFINLLIFLLRIFGSSSDDD